MQPETLQDLDLEHYQLSGPGTSRSVDGMICYLDPMLTYRADQHGTQQGSPDADK